MTSGKTSLGKKLAIALDYVFIDLDEVIEFKTQKSIPMLFSEFGEVYFRKIESETLLEVIEKYKNKQAVIALGGGTVCNDMHIQKIKESGLLVYLTLPLKVIIGRLKADNEKRPMVNTIAPEEFVKNVTKLYDEREFFYEQAHLKVDALWSKNQLKNAILAFIENQK